VHHAIGDLGVPAVVVILHLNLPGDQPTLRAHQLAKLKRGFGHHSVIRRPGDVIAVGIGTNKQIPSLETVLSFVHQGGLQARGKGNGHEIPAVAVIVSDGGIDVPPIRLECVEEPGSISRAEPTW
jgi:hypothetical protein